MSESYFTTDDGLWFTPTGWTRGPWDADACHAGPPTALMVRAMEAIVPGLPLVRITTELMRPIPMTGFRVQAEVRKPGRQMVLTEAEIFDDDHVYARAFGLHLAEREMELPNIHLRHPSLADAVPGPFPIRQTPHGKTAFPASIECRYDPRFSVGKGGETLIWVRTIPTILPDEEPSPIQRICPLADSGNGISWNRYLDEVHFINPDLTLWLHRPPTGEWFGSHVVSHWQETGIGASEATLYDTEGPVGGATQTLLLFPQG